MTTATKSVAAATAASLVGLGVTVFWPEPAVVPPPAPTMMRVDGSGILEKSTNLINWTPCATNVFSFAEYRAGFIRGVASFTVAWDSPHDATVAGYRVYCNGVAIDAGTNLEAVVEAQGLTNTMYATSYDAYGVESDPSNVIVIPAVKPILTITKL